MPSTKEILIEARKLIERPEDWGQGFRWERGERHCMGEAIGLAVGRDNHTGSYGKVCDAIRIANEIATGIPEFNDTHTHAEVLAAFDRAIEAA